MESSTSGLLKGADDIAVNFRDEHEAKVVVRHPVALFFHLFFRVAAVVVYLLCGWFSDSFIGSFVCIVLILSMDFWVVKNITGRLLAGLRWWNYIDDEDGKSHWVFESRQESDDVVQDPTEVRIFWMSLVICPAVWIILFFITIFRLNFKWFVLVVIGIVLNGANLYGYVRCKIKNREKFSSIAANFFGQHLLKNMMSALSKAPQESQQKAQNSSFSGTV